MWRTLIASAVVLVTVLVGTPANAWPTAPSGWTLIMNENSKLYLYPRNNNSGVGVLQNHAYEPPTQGMQWRITLDADGLYRIRSGYSTQHAMTVNTSSGAVNHPLNVGTNSSTDRRQKFKIESTGRLYDGYREVWIIHADTGKCLGIPGGSFVLDKQAFAMDNCNASFTSLKWWIKR